MCTRNTFVWRYIKLMRRLERRGVVRTSLKIKTVYIFVFVSQSLDPPIHRFLCRWLWYVYATPSAYNWTQDRAFDPFSLCSSGQLIIAALRMILSVHRPLNPCFLLKCLLSIHVLVLCNYMYRFGALRTFCTLRTSIGWDLPICGQNRSIRVITWSLRKSLWKLSIRLQLVRVSQSKEKRANFDFLAATA